jgi:hypothetical protein
LLQLGNSQFEFSDALVRVWFRFHAVLHHT